MLAMAPPPSRTLKDCFGEAPKVRSQTGVAREGACVPRKLSREFTPSFLRCGSAPLSEQEFVAA